LTNFIPFKEIAIDKFSGSGSFPGTSVFMEISSFHGKQEIHIIPFQAKNLLNIYKNKDPFRI